MRDHNPIGPFRLYAYSYIADDGQRYGGAIPAMDPDSALRAIEEVWVECRIDGELMASGDPNT